METELILQAQSKKARNNNGQSNQATTSLNSAISNNIQGNEEFNVLLPNIISLKNALSGTSTTNSELNQISNLVNQKYPDATVFDYYLEDNVLKVKYSKELSSLEFKIANVDDTIKQLVAKRLTTVIDYYSENLFKNIETMIRNERPKIDNLLFSVYQMKSLVNLFLDEYKFQHYDLVPFLFDDTLTISSALWSRTFNFHNQETYKYMLYSLSKLVGNVGNNHIFAFNNRFYLGFNIGEMGTKIGSSVIRNPKIKVTKRVRGQSKLMTIVPVATQNLNISDRSTPTTTEKVTKDDSMIYNPDDDLNDSM